MEKLTIAVDTMGGDLGPSAVIEGAVMALREFPDIEIVSPPERKQWGAYSFWFLDPDGNRIAVAQVSS